MAVEYFNTVLLGGINIMTYCILKVVHKSLVSSSGEVIDCTQLNTTEGFRVVWKKVWEPLVSIQ